jgi:hypothetical protein
MPDLKEILGIGGTGAQGIPVVQYQYNPKSLYELIPIHD